MKKNWLYLLLYFFSSSLCYSQESTSSEFISDVSKILTIIPGLYILDVSNFPDYSVHELNCVFINTRKHIKGSMQPIDEKLFVFSLNRYSGGSMIKDEVIIFHIKNGAKTIIEAPYNPEPPHVNDIGIVSFFNQILSLYLGYSMGPGRDRLQIVRITGDWKSIGIDIPVHSTILSQNYFFDKNKNDYIDDEEILLLYNYWAQRRLLPPIIQENSFFH